MSYRLSPAANDDLSRIYSYGIYKFGEQQADRYIIGLLDFMDDIPSNPKAFPRSEDVLDYRRAVYRRVSIYYRLEDDVVIVVRIIGQQDPLKAFGI